MMCHPSFLGFRLKPKMLALVTPLNQVNVFQKKLGIRILRLEFERKNPDDKTGLITESQFADLILAYADYNVKKKSNVLKRVRKAYKKKKKKQEQYEAGK